METIREIDISEIDARSKGINKEINYDEVRNRIRQVLDKITDKKNRGKKVSQDTIGKYLFPHLGADSSTQSTMSRFVNGNKKTKNLSDNCPDIKALTRLSQLTGISTDWFLYGKNSSEIDNKKKTLRDYARLMLIDMKNDLGATFTFIDCPHGETPIELDANPTIRIDIPLRTNYIKDHPFEESPATHQIIYRETAASDLLIASRQVVDIYDAMDKIPADGPSYIALEHLIDSTIQKNIPALPVYNDGGTAGYDNPRDPDYIPF